MATGGNVIGLKGTSGHGNVLTGTRHMVAAGHYAAAHAGFLVLEAGGNAVDSGVAAGLALGVTQCDLVNVAGVAPIMIRLAKTGEVVTIDGLGVWPMKASSQYFRDHHKGAIPAGLMRAVVPGAPSGWITALERYGTMSFGDVAAASIRLAREGFAADPRFCDTMVTNEASFRRFPENARVMLPGGKPPQPGDIFVQTDLARSLQYMADEEKRASGKGRAAGLAAAHAAFYQGDIARTITAYHAKNGGWLSMEDMGAFRARVEPPTKVRFQNMDVFTCGPWCQGPALAMILKMLARDDLRALGHNTPAYIHLLTEAVKLAFSDREAFFGDPRFIDVPLPTLLSDAYAAERRRQIDAARSCPEMPAPGVIPGYPRFIAGAPLGDVPPHVAGHLLSGRRRQARQCVLSHAERSLLRCGDDPGHRLVSLGTWVAVVDYLRPSLRGGAVQAPAPDTEPCHCYSRRRPGRHAVWYAGRRRADAVHAAGASQRRSVRHGPAQRHRGAALCQLLLPVEFRAARVLSEPAGRGGPNRGQDRRRPEGTRP